MPHEWQQRANNISGGEYKLNAHWMKLLAWGGKEKQGSTEIVMEMTNHVQGALERAWNPMKLNGSREVKG